MVGLSFLFNFACQFVQYMAMAKYLKAPINESKI